MKINIKTLDQQTLSIEFDERRSVWELKQHLGNMPEINADPDILKLIYGGRILENKDKLDVYSIDAEKCLVVMGNKTKNIASPKNNNAESTTIESDESLHEDDDNEVNQLRRMGFNEKDVMHALDICNNNTIAAIEHLVNSADMPEPEPTTVVSNAELNRVFSGNLGFLRENPAFIEMRRTLRDNPDMVQIVLTKLSEQNSDLYDTLEANQDELIALLQEDTPRPSIDMGEVQLTDQETESVRRLVELGFARSIAVRAYLALNKNEELAADFLFHQMDSDTDDDYSDDSAETDEHREH